MKMKPSMLWFSRTKKELCPWFQSLWFPSRINFCLHFFSNSLKCGKLWEWLCLWTWAGEVTACVNFALFVSWERILLPSSPWLPNIIFSKKLKAKWPYHSGLPHSPQSWGGGRDDLGWDMNLCKWQQVMCSAPTPKGSRVPADGIHCNETFPGTGSDCMLSYFISGCV